MKKRSLFIGIILMGVGLAGWKFVHRSLTLDKYPIILGHGGMGVRSTLPLNSLASINKALSYPIGGTEMDVKMTPDAILVAFHDQELDKHTNCSGNIASTLFSELEDCENKTWLQSEPIPTVNSILERAWPDSTTFSFDLKLDPQMEGDYLSVFVMQIIELIKKYPQHHFLIESQSLETLDQLKYWKVDAELFLYAHRPNSAFSLALDHKLNGISMNMNQILKIDIEQAHKKNLKVMIWGTGSVFSNREALKLGADIIQTDDIASMVRILQKTK